MKRKIHSTLKKVIKVLPDFPERRKEGDRRKPGDRRFPGRLVDKRSGDGRVLKERRSGKDRRKS